MKNPFTNIKKSAQKLKQQVLIISLALNDNRTPFIAKLMIALTISYAVSPIDLIPDFIPIIGYLDDLIILPIMIYFSIKLIPREVFDDCKIKVTNNTHLNKKFGIFSAVVIILVWILLVIFLISKIC